MPTISCGKRPCFTDVPGHALPERIIPACPMRRFPGLFSHTAVGLSREHRRIGVPEVAETEASARGSRNPMPEPPTGAFAVIADDNGDDLPRPTAQDRPQPAVPRPLADKRPDFIDFQPVVRLRRGSRGPKRRQRVKFFLSRRCSAAAITAKANSTA
jgi:hypothetical protein